MHLIQNLETFCVTVFLFGRLNDITTRESNVHEGITWNIFVSLHLPSSHRVLILCPEKENILESLKSAPVQGVIMWIVITPLIGSFYNFTPMKSVYLWPAINQRCPITYIYHGVTS